MNKKMKAPTRRLVSVTIPRETWLRGDNMNSYLWRKEDCVGCCLGHVGLACGLEKGDMLDLETPADVADGLENAPFFGRLTDPEFAERVDKAMAVNDHVDTRDAYKEAALIKLLKPVGFDLVFTGKRRPTPNKMETS